MADRRTTERRGGDRGIKGALTRKIGPLPAWAWLAILAGVLYFIRSRTSSSQTTTATGSTANTTDTAGQDAIGEYQSGYQQGEQNAGYGGGGGGDTSGGGDTTGSGLGSIDPGDLANAITAGILAAEPEQPATTPAATPSTGGEHRNGRKGKAASTSRAGEGSSHRRSRSTKRSTVTSQRRGRARATLAKPKATAPRGYTRIRSRPARTARTQVRHTEPVRRRRR